MRRMWRIWMVVVGYAMLGALGWAFGAAAVGNFVVAVSMCAVAVAAGLVVVMMEVASSSSE